MVLTSRLYVCVCVTNYRAGLGPTHSAILQTLSESIPVANLKLCKNSNVPSELLAMEERQVIRSYKFGLLYAKDGQTTEQEMFNNKYDDTSKAYKEFLTFIGEKIELQNWKGYRAGLDVVGSCVWPRPPKKKLALKKMNMQATSREHIQSTPNGRDTRSCSTSPPSSPSTTLRLFKYVVRKKESIFLIPLPARAKATHRQRHPRYRLPGGRHARQPRLDRLQTKPHLCRRLTARRWLQVKT